MFDFFEKIEACVNCGKENATTLTWLLSVFVAGVIWVWLWVWQLPTWAWHGSTLHV